MNVVDYYESSGHGFDHYCDWLNERGYRGVVWVPPDAKVREPGAPKRRTRIESLIYCGREECPQGERRRPRLVPDPKLMDGVNAGRKTIPFARFDAQRCGKGLEALREYKAEWDQDNRVFRKTQAYNWASHAADAWRYLSLAWREPVAAEEQKPMRGALEMTLDELWGTVPKRPDLECADLNSRILIAISRQLYGVVICSARGIDRKPFQTRGDKAVRESSFSALMKTESRTFPHADRAPRLELST